MTTHATKEENHAESELAPAKKPRIIVTMEGGIVQDVISDLDMDVVIVDYDTDGAGPTDTIPFYGTEAYVNDEVAVTVQPALVTSHLADIQSGKDVQRLRIETERELADVKYIGAFCFVSIKHTLYPNEYSDLLLYAPYDEMELFELYFEYYKIMGFIKKSLRYDQEIIEHIKAIGNDVSLKPADNIVRTKSGHHIAIMERMGGSDGGEK